MVAMAVMPVLLAVLRLLLAIVFVVSAVTKLRDRSGFKSALGSFAVPDSLRAPAAVVIPASELAIGIGLLPRASMWIAAVGALGLLAVFTAALVASLVRGRRPACHCFGQLSSAPVSWKTVLRNGVLIAAAASIVAQGRADTGPSMVAWAGRLSPLEVLGLAAAVVIVGVMAIETWVLAHVLRQNGRLLLRLDALETSLIREGLHTAPAPRPAAVGPPAGLPVGVQAPAFQLDRLGGGTATTTELLASAKPLALAFVDPDCGPCAALLPELARWEQELVDQLSLAVITTGSMAANNRKLEGLGLGHVLVQQGREVSEAYQAYGTPSMVLVEPRGTIGSPVALGSDAIRGLIARFTQSHLQPEGIERLPGSAVPTGSNGARGGGRTGVPPGIGQPAPTLRLPDLGGRQVSLATFRGHPTLVLFWNPACGYCQSMLDDLKARETGRSATSPRLLVVSAGSVEANRAMGLQGPVTLDERFETGRAFGAGGTPSAVLVDKDGRIASEVAVGAPAVLALADGQAAAVGTGV
jgi:thiol-disulfide isomerase/thioredoxin